MIYYEAINNWDSGAVDTLRVQLGQIMDESENGIEAFHVWRLRPWLPIFLMRTLSGEYSSDFVECREYLPKLTVAEQLI